MGASSEIIRYVPWLATSDKKGGSGLTLGAVLGRKAGKDAARSLTSDKDGVRKAV